MIGEWRYDAACLGRAPMWDSFVEGETVEERAVRQERAQDVCETCPVKVQCRESIDYERDEGVRAGIILVSLKGVASYGVVEGVRRSPRSDRKAS